MKRKKMLIARRGVSATCPENTLPAFVEQTLRLDVGAIGFGVQLSRDGESAVTHDDRADRCGSGIGRGKDPAFEELRRLGFGSWNAPDRIIPRLKLQLNERVSK